MSRPLANAFRSEIQNHGPGFYGSTLQPQGDINFHLPSASNDAIECLQALKLTDPRDDRRDILERKDELLNGTADWVCQDEAFIAWNDSPGSPVLWLHGDAGKGKTMLMIALAGEMQRRLTGQDEVLAFYFCRSTDKDASSAQSVLRGLIYLLAITRPTLAQYVQQRYRQGESKLFDSMDISGLWGILTDMVRDKSLTKVCLMVDALDECDHNVEKLLNYILRPDLRLPDKVKWLLSSRNEEHIRELLTHYVDRVHVSLEINAERVAKAVATFIEKKVNELSRLKRYDAELQSFVTAYLSTHSSGTFLWVALVCKAMRNVPPRLVRKEIVRFPRDLDPLYGRMKNKMDDSNDAEAANAILRAAMIANKPLTLQEIRFVADLPVEEFREESHIEQVIKAMGSFLTVQGNAVHFVHQSALQYLHERMTVEALGHEQGIVAMRCFDLLRDKLKMNMHGINHPAEAKSTLLTDGKVIILPFDVKYACLNWAHHLKFSTGDMSEANHQYMTRRLRLFLEKTFLNWLESLSFLSSVVHGLLIMQELEAIIKSKRFYSEAYLLAATADGIRFLRDFHAIIETHPLQIYCSGLALTSQKSMIKANFVSDTPHWLINGEMKSTDTYQAYDSPSDTDSEEDVQITCPPLFLLDDHKASVTLLKISPNGKYLASASEDGDIKLWSLETGALIFTTTSISKVIMMLFSHDSSTLAAGCSNGTLRIWTSRDPLQVKVFNGHTAAVRCIAFSRTDDRLVSCSDSMDARLFCLKTFSELWAFHNFGERQTMSALFSYDGSLVILISIIRTISIRQVQDGTLLPGLHHGRIAANTAPFQVAGPSPSAILSPSGRYLAVCQRAEVDIWDLQSQTMVGSFDHRSERLPSYSSIAWIDELRCLFFHGTRGTLIVNNNGAWFPVPVSPLPSTLMGYLTLSADGEYLACSSFSTLAEVYNPVTGKLRKILDDSSMSIKFDFSLKHAHMVAGSEGMTIRVWDLESAVVSAFTTRNNLATKWVKLSSDGEILIGGQQSNNGLLRTWRMSSLSLESDVTCELGQTVSPDGRSCVRYDYELKSLIAEDLTNGTRETVVPRIPLVPTWWSLDGSVIAGRLNEIFELYSTVTWQRLLVDSRISEDGRISLTTCEISEGGDVVALHSSSTSLLRVHTAPFGNSSGWAAHVARLFAVSNTGAYLLYRQQAPSLILVRNARTGERLRSLDRGEDISEGLFVFSPQDELVVYVQKTGNMRMWNMSNGMCIASCIGMPSFDSISLRQYMGWPIKRGDPHTPPRQSLQLSHDRRWIMSGDQRLLWLPPRYRGEDLFASRRLIAVVSDGSDNITKLEIDPTAAGVDRYRQDQCLFDAYERYRQPHPPEWARVWQRPDLGERMIVDENGGSDGRSTPRGAA